LWATIVKVLKTLSQANKGASKPLSGLVGEMYANQGISGFYRGVEVNIARACILNATKMGVYDLTKGYVTEYTGWSRKDVRVAFSSAFVAGFFMTCTVSPADNLRTRLMNQPTDKKIYNGFVDCAVKTVRNDGVLSLWRGFIPIWARFAPQATLQLLTIEALYTLCGFKSI
jgi:Mitochondrial carrier protein